MGVATAAGASSFSEAQRLIADAFAAYLRDAWTPAMSKAHLEDASLFDADLWKGLGAQGWVGAYYPESAGGQGMAFEDLMAILREAGRAALVGPFVTSAALVPLLLAATGAPVQAPAALAAGDDVATMALYERPLSFPLSGVTAAIGTGGMHGAKSHVPCVTSAQRAFVLGRDGQGLALGEVDPGGAGAKATAWRTLDGENLGALELDGAPVLSCTAVTEAALEAFVLRAAVALTALQVGGAEAAIDAIVDYANERVQFGRVIASFQAVSHKIADMYCNLAVGRALHVRATRAIEREAADWAVDASMAKAFNNDMYRTVTNGALQLFGGIGYTWEHDIHLHLRAAQSLAGQFGTTAHHRARLKRAWAIGASAGEGD